MYTSGNTLGRYSYSLGPVWSGAVFPHPALIGLSSLAKYLHNYVILRV